MSSTSSSRRQPWWPLAIVPVLCAALFGATAVVVQAYYQTRPPHYDSVAHYAFMFDLMNAVQRDGLLVAIRQGAQYSHSWLHPVFALLLAWVPVRAPWLLVSLNFVLLAAAELSLLAYLRTTDAGPWRQAASLGLPLLPASLYVWDGGLPDLRRDCQYVLLLMAVFFMGLAWARKPSTRSAAVLGVLVGLTVWSRDNAASGLGIVAVPVAVVALAHHGLIYASRMATLPAAILLAITAPYVAVTAESTWYRYSFMVWGIAENRSESLARFWRTPLDVLLGGAHYLNGLPANRTSTVLLFCGLGALLLFGLITRLLRLEPSRLRQRWVLELAVSGLWVVAAFVAYNCLVLGYGARFHGIPFVPVLIGDVAMILALTNAVTIGELGQRRPAFRPIIPLLVVVLVFGAAPWRITASAFDPRGAEVVTSIRDASLLIADIVRERGLLQLWITGFSEQHIDFYLTMHGRPPLKGVYTTIADEPGQPFLWIQPLRPDHDPAVLRHKLGLIAREAAPYVLVAEDPALYHVSDDAVGQLWLLAIGRSLIEELLADPRFVRVARFSVEGTPLLLLENRRLVADTGIGR